MSLFADPMYIKWFLLSENENFGPDILESSSGSVSEPSLFSRQPSESFSDLPTPKKKIDYFKNIKWSEVRPSRAGVIPFTIAKGKKGTDILRFCLGVNTKYSTLTDFGGGVNYLSSSSTKSYFIKTAQNKSHWNTFPSNRDKTAYHGAFREFFEESLGIFFPADATSSPPDRESLQKLFPRLEESIVIYDEKNLIIFLHIDNINIKKSRKVFNKKLNKILQTQQYSEIKDIVWISKNKFTDLIDFLLSKNSFKFPLHNIDVNTLIEGCEDAAEADRIIYDNMEIYSRVAELICKTSQAGTGTDIFSCILFNSSLPIEEGDNSRTNLEYDPFNCSFDLFRNLRSIKGKSRKINEEDDVTNITIMIFS